MAEDLADTPRNHQAVALLGEVRWHGTDGPRAL